MPMSGLIRERVPDPMARALYQHLTGANLQGDEDTSSGYAATAGVGPTHADIGASDTEQSSGGSESTGESSGGLRW